MEQLATISQNFFRANGFHKSRSPSSPWPCSAGQSADYIGRRCEGIREAGGDRGCNGIGGGCAGRQVVGGGG